MITYTTGNLLHAETEALVNAINCVGVMGKGIALQFKQAFPLNFQEYKKACQAKLVKPGVMFTVTQEHSNPKYIINFPTKSHWRSKSKLADIEAGLIALVEEIETLNIQSIALPALGCGHGGLDWEEVKPLLEKYLQTADVQVLVYAPIEKS